MFVYIKELEDCYTIYDADCSVITSFELNALDDLIAYIKKNNYMVSACSDIFVKGFMIGNMEVRNHRNVEKFIKFTVIKASKYTRQRVKALQSGSGSSCGKKENTRN